MDEAEPPLRFREPFRDRLRHPLKAVGDEQLGAPDAARFDGFEEFGPIAGALLRDGPEVQDLPPPVFGHADRDFDAFLRHGRRVAVSPPKGDVGAVHEDDDAFREGPAAEFLRPLRQFGDEPPRRLPRELEAGIGGEMLGDLIQRQTLQIKPLDKVFQIRGRPLVRLQHLRFEERHPVPRNAEGKRAVRGFQNPFVIAVPVDLPIGGVRRLRQEILDFAVQSLVERPFELGSDEGIQILPQR